MKITIKDIAEAAKVSRGTVDKVLNDRKGVSHEVREKVINIAQTMGYKPNLAGKALAFQKNPVKIGVIILNKDDPLFQEVHKGVLQAFQEFKDFGIAIEIRFMDNISIEDQLRCIRELAKQNIIALALSPLDEEIIKKELQILTEDNIKILTFNTDIDVEKFCFIGQNLVQSGRVAGELMGKLLLNGGKVAVISGPPKIKALQERLQGFRSIIECEYNTVNIAEVFDDINNDEDTFANTLKLVNNHPDLKGIFITGTGVGGVGRALKAIDKHDIRLICYDLRNETINLLKNKTIDFTITQDPFMQGYQSIKVFFDYFLKSQKPFSNNIYTRLEIITKENLEI